MKNKEKYIKNFIEKLSNMTTHDLAEFMNIYICNNIEDDCFIVCPAYKYCKETNLKIKTLKTETILTCTQILEGWLDKEIEELTEESDNEND